MKERVEVNDVQITDATAGVVAHMQGRIAQKGRGSFISAHESLGSLEEEMFELKLAIHSKIEKDVLWELEDIAVGAIFAIASIRANRKAMTEEATRRHASTTP